MNMHWEMHDSHFQFDIFLCDAEIGKRVYCLHRRDANTLKNRTKVGLIYSEPCKIVAVIDSGHYDTQYPSKENIHHKCMPAFLKWLYEVKLSS